MGFEEEDGRFDPKNRRFQARLLKIRVLGPLGCSNAVKKAFRLFLGLEI